MSSDSQATPEFLSGMNHGDRALAKVRTLLVPCLFLLYLVACLDRVNVSFAAAGLSKDLGLDPATYGYAAGVFFAGYILFEVPSNLLLLRLGARRWIGRILVSWGCVAMLMAAMTNASQFDTLRLLLGIAEAGFFPGMVLYLSQWVPSSQRAHTLASFMLAIPMAGLLGGPMSAALLSLDGVLGLAGWRWLFLVEGLPAVVLGIAVGQWLPNRPRDAGWLLPAEATALEARLEQDRYDHLQCGHQAASLRWALMEPRLWCLLAMYLAIYYGITSFGFWIPRFVADALAAQSPSPAVVNLVSALPYALAVIAMLWVGRSADRQGDLALHVAVPLLLAVMALGLAIASSGPLRLAFLSVATAATFSCKGPFWAIPPRFLAGRAAAAGLAVISTSGSIGGLISPNVMGHLLEVPGGEALALGSLAGVLLVAALLAMPVRASILPL